MAVRENQGTVFRNRRGEIECYDAELTGGDICWKVDRGDPLLFSPMVNTFYVLNPLSLYRNLISRGRPTQYLNYRPLVVGDSVYLWCKHFALVRSPESPMLEGPAMMLDIMPAFLAALRTASGQVHMRVYPDGCGSLTVKEEPPVFPEASTVAGRLSGTHRGSAVSYEAAARAASLMADPSTDVHHVILMDSAEAWVVCDYRRCIVYAASAMEIAAHATISASGRNDDPVLAALPRRFAELLHERMLYISGRSLKIDLPECFARARRVYETRNTIMHAGVPSKREQLPLTSDAGRLALDTAREVFAWLGYDAPYLKPTPSVQGFEAEL